MTERCVCTVTDDTLCSLIAQARRRVVFVAPGASERVAEALASTWWRIGSHAVSVVLDVDPEVCRRLGYGEEAAIPLLQHTAMELGQSLCEQPGVHIGLLIVDEKTLVYSATPRLVEPDEPPEKSDPDKQTSLFPEPTAPPRSNAILLQGTPPELARDLGTGPDGDAARTVGLDHVDEKKVIVLQANSQLEFVEMEVRGCSVSRRTASIPADVMGLALEDKTRNRLRSSFRVISGPRHKGVHKAVMSPPQARKAIKDSLVEIVDRPPSERQIEEMWRYFNNACAFCGGKLVREDRKGHYDHLVPISRGGLNHISNRVLVSWKCNGDRKRETNWEEHDDSLELSRAVHTERHQRILAWRKIHRFDRKELDRLIVAALRRSSQQRSLALSMPSKRCGMMPDDWQVLGSNFDLAWTPPTSRHSPPKPAAS